MKQIQICRLAAAFLAGSGILSECRGEPDSIITPPDDRRQRAERRLSLGGMTAGGNFIGIFLEKLPFWCYIIKIKCGLSALDCLRLRPITRLLGKNIF